MAALLLAASASAAPTHQVKLGLQRAFGGASRGYAARVQQQYGDHPRRRPQLSLEVARFAEAYEWTTGSNPEDSWQTELHGRLHGGYEFTPGRWGHLVFEAGGYRYHLEGSWQYTNQDLAQDYEATHLLADLGMRLGIGGRIGPWGLHLSANDSFRRAIGAQVVLIGMFSLQTDAKNLPRPQPATRDRSTTVRRHETVRCQVGNGSVRPRVLY